MVRKEEKPMYPDNVIFSISLCIWTYFTLETYNLGEMKILWATPNDIYVQ